MVHFFTLYKNLYETLSHHILNKLYRAQRPVRIPELMAEYGVTELDLLHTPTASTDLDAALPACQRAASDPKYKILFLDETLSHHILNKLYRAQRPVRIPELMAEYGVTEWEAEKLFLYMLHGNFAVNKSLGWDRGPDWYHAQKIIRDLMRP